MIPKFCEGVEALTADAAADEQLALETWPIEFMLVILVQNWQGVNLNYPLRSQSVIIQ